jgi:serine/threonine protein kinase
LSRTCPDCQSTYDDEVLHCPEDGHNLALEPAVDELIGRTVGSYTVVKPLGKGGMGAVYMGEHPVIGSRVAIKFLHPQYAHDEKIVDRFFNEARAVNVIGHDNILKIIDLNVTEDNRHYFVMEFLLGRALQNLIKHHVAIPLEVSGPILLQICEALEAAHRKGIIHRDLKPDNIYLISHKGKKNFVKVVDFGIAKLTDVQGASTGRTQTGMVMGTPAYMSPEQGSGKTSTIDGRSDIYSLGIIMFQLATGRLPFRGEDFGAMLVAHLQQAPPDPRELAAGTPEEFAQIILRCLEKSQDDRFQSMAELGEAIAACMDRLGISRDLPADDATDFELNPVELRELRASSNPGLRTPSQPGRSTTPVTGRGSSPGARPGPRSNPGASSPGARKSLPGARPAGEGSSTPPRSRSLPPTPPPAAGSKLPILAGVIGALILVGGGIGYGVKLGNEGRAGGGQGQRHRGARGQGADRGPARRRGGRQQPDLPLGRLRSARGRGAGQLEGRRDVGQRAALGRGAAERQGPLRDPQGRVPPLRDRGARRSKSGRQREARGVARGVRGHRGPAAALAAQAGWRPPEGRSTGHERRRDRPQRRPQVRPATPPHPCQEFQSF